MNFAADLCVLRRKIAVLALNQTPVARSTDSYFGDSPTLALVIVINKLWGRRCMR
jgi:hypothetical protein